MIKYYYKKTITLSLLVVLLLAPTGYVISDSLNYSISKPLVFKRNKGSCKRLGNVYDSCHWMTKLVIRNTGNEKISNLCLMLRVNKKKYELCYGKTKKLLIDKNGKKVFLINLTELMNIPIDAEKPFVKILTKI